MRHAPSLHTPRIARTLWHRLRTLVGTGGPDHSTLEDLDAESLEIYERVRPYTMTGLLRTHALIQAVHYVASRQLSGALVECGVWRGGAVLAMLLKLMKLGVTHYDVYLYDTFEGMTEPGVHDTSAFERPALNTWRAAQAANRKAWADLFSPEAFSLETVRETVLSSGYPESRIHFIHGAVELTVPQQAPAQIALLRLDTDWFASTRHALVHLYPRLSKGGVLIVDDYGHWQGCRKAVDEYFAGAGVPSILLNRIDYTGRIGIKC